MVQKYTEGPCGYEFPGISHTHTHRPLGCVTQSQLHANKSRVPLEGPPRGTGGNAGQLHCFELSRKFQKRPGSADECQQTPACTSDTSGDNSSKHSPEDRHLTQTECTGDKQSWKLPLRAVVASWGSVAACSYAWGHVQGPVGAGTLDGCPVTEGMSEDIGATSMCSENSVPSRSTAT